MTKTTDFSACERIPSRAYNGANGKKIVVRCNGDAWLVKFPPSGAAEIAPAFDFGSCLLPQADDGIMRRVIEDKAERDARIYNFPASVLKENGKKINYVDFIAKNRDGVLAPSLARIVPRIDMAAIFALIDDTPLLTDLQRRFYKTYLAARFEALLDARWGI